MKNTGINKTHPLVLGAAASVLLASLVLASALTGLLPIAHSGNPDAATRSAATASAGAPHAPPKLAAYSNECASCGTVESIRRVMLTGAASGLGAVAGGVTGAVVGNQMGRGNGNTAMTILGAAGGAIAGNEIEKNVNTRYAYRVRVRMDDGALRTVSQSSPPSVAVGEQVRIVNGAIVSRS
ncbi:MAG: glycine zipper 2TM domain-containing protein [Burkholderiales bacterium]|nr:glycine zipper 2TM domain-containing protein [Burkholderiales bacterium]